MALLLCHSPPPLLFVSVLGISSISVSAYHPLRFCFSNLFSFPLPPPPIVTASEDVQGNFWCSQTSNLRRPHISPLLLLLVKMCKAILDVSNFLIFTVPPSFPILLLLVKNFDVPTNSHLPHVFPHIVTASQDARPAWSADPCMQVNRWTAPCNVSF